MLLPAWKADASLAWVMDLLKGLVEFLRWNIEVLLSVLNIIAFVSFGEVEECFLLIFRVIIRVKCFPIDRVDFRITPAGMGVFKVAQEF